MARSAPCSPSAGGVVPVWRDGYASGANAHAACRSVRTKLRPWSDRLSGAPGYTLWGAPIVFLSACLAIPPRYAVTLAVPVRACRSSFSVWRSCLGGWCCSSP